MRKAVAIVTAFCATSMLVPVPFVTALLLLLTPAHDAPMFGRMAEFYAMIAVATMIYALPGFAVARFGLWKLGGQSPVAFAIAGASTGVLAAVLISLQGDFSDMRAFHLDLIGGIVGAVAGILYLCIERLLFRRFVFARDTLPLGQPDQ